MTSSALLGFLCSFELCLALGTQQEGKHPQLCCSGAEMPHRRAPLPVPMPEPTPSSRFPEHFTSPIVQVLFLLQPFYTARGFLLVESMERSQVIHLCLIPFLKVGCGTCPVLPGWVKNSFCCSQCVLGSPERKWVFCGAYYCAAAISHKSRLWISLPHCHYE